MSLIAALGEEHARFSSTEAQIRALLDGGDIAAAVAAFEVLAHDLTHHTDIEERSLFVELAEVSPGTVAELLDEHADIDASAARLAAAGTDTERAAVIVAALDVLHAHIHREEYDVFPAAVQLIGPAGWSRIESAADEARDAAGNHHSHDGHSHSH